MNYFTVKITKPWGFLKEKKKKKGLLNKTAVSIAERGPVVCTARLLEEAMCKSCVCAVREMPSCNTAQRPLDGCRK